MAGIAVVGPGRVGLSLARALAASGERVALLGRESRSLPEPLGEVVTDWDSAVAASSTIIIAVPDDDVRRVASRLAGIGPAGKGKVVLHVSGLLDRSALSALEPTGAALGSFHPLQSFSDRAGSPELLEGSPAVIEGDPAALTESHRIAALLGMSPVVTIAAEQKARYHAAAVMASNYVVVLAELAGELARQAGIDAGSELFQPLMAATIARLVDTEPMAALTGPIRRGDAETVAAHLAVLDGETAELYRLLGRQALKLACSAGLDGEKADAIRELLVDGL